ncbi:SAV_6107 family HEPN domain-containing protein [Corynebacterium pseudodiphtheriticum]|uniref:SAV_6107 family HEPN domain-containing protein n=1 Tax=Corynebacterium pseudodiphtheriticum TaxID=37637 RepID=UPI0020BE9432|nr:SAV_6107 family HEPN domain-containing protein [Corynebacterium pseudodiphtheriticum]UQV57605.1 SAV_6107 family HEPN domain-containing protein [Corynebacterium pseudodiphtheriticum]
MMTSQVISATTKFNHTTDVSRARHQKLLDSAVLLVEQAREQFRAGEDVRAFELAYMAGLRLAGARVALSPVERKRRKPSSAWGQLALVDAEAERWAQRFQQFSGIRRDIDLGQAVEVSQLQVISLIKLVSEFLAEVSSVAPVVRSAA